MARPEKEAIVQLMKEKLESSTAVILTDYRGLNVKEVTELRKKLSEAGVEYKVIKNTLTLLGARQAQIEGLEDYLKGPTAAAFSVADPVAPAKVISEFMKTHKNLEIKAGILKGKVIGLEDVKALANLPSREVLLAQLLGGMKAPINGLVNVLAGNIRNLVYVLNAIREAKEGA